MVTIKRLSECTLTEGVTAWNKGFEGYVFNMTTTLEQYTRRMGLEGLSPELSVIAFDGERPIGFVLNGIRTIDGKKLSWNGGTGIDPEYRGKRIGRLLMDETLAIYKENNVEIATLEAVKENENAIKLYEKMGYVIVDELVHLQHAGNWKEGFQREGNSSFKIEKGIPIDAAQLPFYKKFVPWQNQWNNARDGQSILVKDSNDVAVGYAIFKRIFNEEGKQIATLLTQCETDPNVSNQEEILTLLLNQVFPPMDIEIQKTAANLSISNKFVYRFLEEAGFEVKARQVSMKKEM